jgi:osmoprotectant transport system ATP-binding protein
MHPKETYLQFNGVQKSFGDVHVLRDFSLDIAQGEIFVLLGPSGCGKSTALQLANRLLDLDAGSIHIDGVDISTMDPVLLRRQIGYVIQQIGLFPHRSVAANIGTVCRLVGWSASAIESRVETLMELVGLPYAEYKNRYPHELSGGQQQRVGVARALAVDPPILLMDEPFAALDPQIRRTLQIEFRSWVTRLGTTVVFVSHDVDEALILGDRIGVMGTSGTLADVGTPLEVLTHPSTDQVRSFLGPDRALKRLSVTPIDADALVPLSVREAPAIARDASLYEAMTTLLTHDVSEVHVDDAQGQCLGALTMASVGEQARISHSRADFT